MRTTEAIEGFLKQNRLAVVGVSRSERDFTRSIFREFVRRGYDAVPVNPAAAEIEGKRCYARVQDISPPVDGVMVMTPPKVSESVVLDCAAAGIKRVWLYRAVGQGAVSKAAVAYCKANAIEVIPGYCPHMFWKDSAFIHRLHGLIARITGAWPQ
jgi:predicted CoA-binding protein